MLSPEVKNPPKKACRRPAAVDNAVTVKNQGRRKKGDCYGVALEV
jgi:hypothetical protein